MAVTVHQRPTRRQLEVLRSYIATGSITSAAHELDIAESTARQHLSGLYRRTGCANAAQAAYLLGRADVPQPIRASQSPAAGSGATDASALPPRRTGHGPPRPVASTVKHHLTNARSKVGATTTAQLVWILGPRLPEPESADQDL